MWDPGSDVRGEVAAVTTSPLHLWLWAINVVALGSRTDCQSAGEETGLERLMLCPAGASLGKGWHFRVTLQVWCLRQPGSSPRLSLRLCGQWA